MSIWGHTCNTAWNLGTSIVTKILTNCWEGERSNKAIGKKGSNDEERLGKKTKLTAISVTMLEDDWWETQLSLKGAWTSKRDRVRIVKMVQEGITKSDGVKLSKRKFKLNLRKKSLLKHIRLLSDCPWGRVQTAAYRLFGLGKRLPRHAVPGEWSTYISSVSYCLMCIICRHDLLKPRASKRLCSLSSVKICWSWKMDIAKFWRSLVSQWAVEYFSVTLGQPSLRICMARSPTGEKNVSLSYGASAILPLYLQVGQIEN